MTVKIVLYSHDSAGLGHIRRNLAIAHALAAGLNEPVTGLLVAGRPEATRFAAPEGWDWLILPGVQHARDGYGSRALDIGLDTATALRGAVFRAAVRRFCPDLVVVDRHPFGVGRELESALRSLRVEQPDCRIVLGLRDVLDAAPAAAAEWRAIGGGSALRSVLDAIWAYGDPRAHDLTVAGELPADLHDLVSHTGYLAHGRIAGHRHGIERPFVLTTVGGGVDGVELAAAAAAAAVPDGIRHLVVTGPQMPDEDRLRVIGAARPGTEVVRRVPDVLPLMRTAEAVVCMAGYNTICEVMSTTTPALVAPRVQRRDEQRIRAGALARIGAIEALSPWQTGPEEIGDWFAQNAGRRTARTGLALDGLARIPVLAAELLTGRIERVAGGDRVAV
ncbi:glycosyltransferase family protein [Leucobacter sp. wl10]|uniref:glycosyltransferase family protein n=1 Tax=Leucobacter sp. wl10 TaxID=2304677 RepID=UPI000E5B5563|nr:glycosyl transferase family 28 [Leucobacter sp. wl10]RGE24270.1 glycosyl transferase family 28 [Leucobacter sp. wl10]